MEEQGGRELVREAMKSSGLAPARRCLFPKSEKGFENPKIGRLFRES